MPTYEEGNIEAARALKKTRYILMSSRKTLQSKDADAREERQIHKGSSLFKTDSIVRKEGYEERYDALLQENQLLFTLDLIKEKLSLAYSQKDEAVMQKTSSVSWICAKQRAIHTYCGLNVFLATTLRALLPTQLMISQPQRLKVSTTRSRLFADRDTDYPDERIISLLKLFRYEAVVLRIAEIPKYPQIVIEPFYI